MGLKKGITNNPNGRKKGVPNKITKDLKESIKLIIENEFESLPETLQQLEPEKRIDVLIKLLPYIVPKLQNIQIEPTKEEEEKKVTIIRFVDFNQQNKANL